MFRSVTDLNVNFLGDWYFFFEVSNFVFWQIGAHATHGAFTPQFVSPLCSELPEIEQEISIINYFSLKRCHTRSNHRFIKCGRAKFDETVCKVAQIMPMPQSNISGVLAKQV
jgi:hypothetical protein